MKPLGLNHILVLALLTSIGGCDLGDKCIADCDSAGQGSGSSSDSAGPTGSGSDGSGSDGSGGSSGAPASCQSNTDAAQAFIEDNRACTTVLDCVSVNSICYQGPLDGPCGSVALSADADLEAWDQLHTELEGCECGANACGSTTVCNDQGLCENVLGLGDVCESYEQDAQTFINENRGCTTDAECILVQADCYLGPERACTAIPLNTSADLDDWETLHDYLESCEENCGGLDCLPPISCSPEGLCVATG